jgi:deazaflavin-dependent oxidoreductase (nitroreductase family)
MRQVRRPTGLLKVVLGFPLLLSRFGLTRLLGNRFVIITHVGRKSARVYRTPVEVVRYEPDADAWTVAAAWGSPPAWYLNITARPALTIEVDGRVVAHPDQQILATSDAADALGTYVGKHRLAAGMLGRFLGWPPLDLPDAIEEITKAMPMVRFSVPPDAGER